MARAKASGDYKPSKGISSGFGKWFIFILVAAWCGFSVLGIAWLISTSLRSDQELFANPWGLPGRTIPLVLGEDSEDLKVLLDGDRETTWTASSEEDAPTALVLDFRLKTREKLKKIILIAGPHPRHLPKDVTFYADGMIVEPIEGPGPDDNEAAYVFEPFETSDLSIEVPLAFDESTGDHYAEIADVKALRDGIGLHWENYRFAWTIARMGEYAANSAVVTAGSVICIILISSMAAYAITKTGFLGARAVFYYFLAGMAVPASLILVPLFMTLKNLNIKDLALFPVGDYWLIHIKNFYLMDSRLGLILIYTTLGIPFTVFILTAFFRTLPTALAESAAIDGASEYATFWHIFLPLAKPGIVTVSIFNFLFVWNEYQFALVFISNESLKTLPVGLYDLSLASQHANNWTALFAGLVILMIPTIIIFLILQDRITRGLTVGAIKE